MKHFTFEDSITNELRGNAILSLSGMISVQVEPEYVTIDRCVELSWFLEMISNFLRNVEADQVTFPIRENQDYNLRMTVKEM